MSQVLSNLTPYIPNSAKFCSVLCSPGRLTSLSTSGPKWAGKVGLGPRTQPPQAHSACFLSSSVTHCSPGPPRPFLVLSTHPHPPPSSASSDWSIIRRCARRLAEALRLSALLLCTAGASLLAFLALPGGSPHASLRCSRVPDPEAEPESVSSDRSREVSVYLAN